MPRRMMTSATVRITNRDTVKGVTFYEVLKVGDENPVQCKIDSCNECILRTGVCLGGPRSVHRVMVGGQYLARMGMRSLIGCLHMHAHHRHHQLCHSGVVMSLLDHDFFTISPSAVGCRILRVRRTNGCVANTVITLVSVYDNTHLSEYFLLRFGLLAFKNDVRVPQSSYSSSATPRKLKFSPYCGLRERPEHEHVSPRFPAL